MTYVTVSTDVPLFDKVWANRFEQAAKQSEYPETFGELAVAVQV